MAGISISSCLPSSAFASSLSGTGSAWRLSANATSLISVMSVSGLPLSASTFSSSMTSPNDAGVSYPFSRPVDLSYLLFVLSLVNLSRIYSKERDLTLRPIKSAPKSTSFGESSSSKSRKVWSPAPGKRAGPLDSSISSSSDHGPKVSIDDDYSSFCSWELAYASFVSVIINQCALSSLPTDVWFPTKDSSSG